MAKEKKHYLVRFGFCIALSLICSGIAVGLFFHWKNKKVEEQLIAEPIQEPVEEKYITLNGDHKVVQVQTEPIEVEELIEQAEKEATAADKDL